MKKNRLTLTLWVLLVVILLVRSWLLGQYPLLGTTEPRYAELARKMLATDDWVTLWVSDGVPLWGKPPLLFWIEAQFMQWWGMSEFVLRLPTFIASLLLIALFWFWPSAKKSNLALFAAVVYITTPFGFFAAGFVATDIFLTLGLTLSMVGFWLAIQDNQTSQINQTTIWHWSFFIGMAIGLLAKGPLAVVLLGLALFVWMLGSPKMRLVMMWQRLPWLRGLLLTMLIAAPWYILAEIRTPGFLHHFIIGEHIERFFVKDWAGGRFAPSHGEPLGMIWWFALQSFMPWLLLTIPACVVAWRTKAWRQLAALPSEQLYLLGWILAPLLLFSPSRNILEAYMLTAVPAFALLMGQFILHQYEKENAWLSTVLMAIPIPFAVVTSVLFFYPVLGTQSQKQLLQNWTQGTQLAYIGGVPPSAAFYSSNQAVTYPSFADLESQLSLKSTQGPITVVLHTNQFEAMPMVQKQKWHLVEAYGAYVMLRQFSP